MRTSFLLTLATCVFSGACGQAQNDVGRTRERLVRGDKEKVEAAGFWMYNDLPGAFEKARETGRPLVVVMRCLPCQQCVKLDDELVDTHPVIRPLLEKFVCVRQVATNGLDLSLFQFDTDQSFVVFFLNADKTVYGRFGTRSHRTEWLGDVSLEGLAKALQGALELHEDYERVQTSLAGKRGEPWEKASPELYPSLKDKYTDKLNYQGDVVKSCIHCHQIGDARREYYWHNNQPIPQKILYPFPHPKVVGLVMDPEEKATVKEVQPDSPAAAAGLEKGDAIESLAGQPLLSIADVQWVLHNVDPDGARVPMTVKRSGRTRHLTLSLEKDWRRADDLSWRVSTWGLRRIAAGGMVLKALPPDQRAKLGFEGKQMALRVERTGRYGPFATARRKGFREGDILTEFDGRADFAREQDLLTYVVTDKQPGDRVEVQLRRDGKSLRLRLPIQQ